MGQVRVGLIDYFYISSNMSNAASSRLPVKPYTPQHIHTQDAGREERQVYLSPSAAAH
jgi:hypothetical protein